MEPEPIILDGGARAGNLGSGSSELHKKYHAFSDFWTKLFWSKSQKSQDVEAGAKKITWPGPEIRVPGETVCAKLLKTHIA